MKKLALLITCALLTLHQRISAFPSSLYWTACTTDVLDTGLGNVQLMQYFTVFREKGRGQFVPPDVGLLFGLASWSDWEWEAGFDYIGGTDYPWFFNTKIGITEDKLFPCAPSFALGMFYIGTVQRRTGFDVFNVIFGKTLPPWLFAGGRLFAGAYTSNLRDDSHGWMVGFQKNFCQAYHCDDTPYWKWSLVADYASGRNLVGGGGVGFFYFFSPNVLLVSGPTWFNDARYNGSWKWTVQLDVTFKVFKTWHEKKQEWCDKLKEKESKDKKTTGTTQEKRKSKKRTKGANIHPNQG